MCFLFAALIKKSKFLKPCCCIHFENFRVRRPIGCPDTNPKIKHHGHADDETAEEGAVDRKVAGNIPGKFFANLFIFFKLAARVQIQKNHHFLNF
jgi:hypothetical protein